MTGISNIGIGGAINAQRFSVDRAAGPAVRPPDTSRGYPVGDGSFASQVRGTSPQPELDLNFALMANDAYKLNATGPTGTQSERELAEAGWTRLTPVGNGLVDAQGNQIPIAPNLLHDPKTGFDAAIYQNAQGQYVVAYRGTDNWSPGEGGDATANGGQGLGLSTRQYEQAIRLAERAEKVFGEGNVAITGHSLGGGLASAAMLAVGAPGATFNAAGLSDNTLRSLGFTSPNAIRSELADSGQIRRYNVAGELLTSLQQQVVSGMPNAVGHELRVSGPPGEINPITLHGGGGDGQAYVESLRSNTALRPGQGSLLQRLGERRAESQFAQLAAAGTHLVGLGSDVFSNGMHVGSEIGSIVRGDFSNGRLAQAAGGVAGSVVDGVADTAASVVRNGTDWAGDAVMQNSTLVGGGLRELGKSTGMGPVADTVANAIEQGGYRANQAIDTAGDWVAKGLDGAGDVLQQGFNALGSGAQWVAGQTAAGAVWAAERAVEGAQWVGEKTVEGAVWAADKTVEGAQWLGDKTVEGAKWVSKTAKDGATWVGERASDAGHWVNRHLNPLNWF